jgi:uncharacterized protein (TIGR02246 family)
MHWNKRSAFALALIGILSCSAVGTAWADPATEHDGLSKRWQTAWDGGDAAGLAALYTKEARLMPPNAKVSTGRAAIEATLRQVMTEMPGKLTVTVSDTGSSGNLGFARGTYVFVNADGETQETGKWLEVRKKVEGQWLIDSDIWNSDDPIPE